MAELLKRGEALEVMNTRPAFWTYGFLANEYRLVAALIQIRE